MAYDQARHVTVLFGGLTPGGQSLTDTWLWDGSTWTQAQPPTTPLLAPMIYDSLTARVLMVPGGSHPMWAWTGSDWMQLQPAHEPDGANPSLAYDQHAHVVVAYGGSDPVDLSLAPPKMTTWTWDGSDWTLRSQTGPAGGEDGGMAYDPSLAGVVHVAGWANQAHLNSQYYNDTWLWNGTAWAQITTPHSPPAGPMAAWFDARQGQLVSVTEATGMPGYPGPTSTMQEWRFDGHDWTAPPQPVGPRARSRAPVAYSVDTGIALLFGGAVEPYHTPAADTWGFGVPPFGYWLVASDGGVFPFGNAIGYGSLGGQRLNQPVVGIAATSDGAGHWLVAADGGIFPFGDAGGYGSTGAIHLNQPIVGMAATPDGRGYWLVAGDGGIFPFGDAGGYGSTGAIHLNQSIVGMAITATGKGYWLVASDGGVFPFGDAVGYGSTGGIHLNSPIVAMAETGDGHGYWLVASDGGIFPFGDAVGYGSAAATHLNKPIVGLAVTGDDGGYWLVAADGGIFPFGDASYVGGTGASTLTQPMVGIASTSPVAHVPPLSPPPFQ